MSAMHFFIARSRATQQLIRHVKELVRSLPLISDFCGSVFLWSGNGEMVTDPRLSQHTHLKMLNLINCPANAGIRDFSLLAC